MKVHWLMAVVLFCVVPTRAAPPLERIVVREGHFIESIGDKPFAPRGFNYMRLRKIDGALWHATFSRQRYDPDRAESMLKALGADGFNTVRVFLDDHPDEGIVETVGAAELSAQYLDHVADFLTRATAHRIRTILVTLNLPPRQVSLTPSDDYPPRSAQAMHFICTNLRCLPKRITWRMSPAN